MPIFLFLLLALEASAYDLAACQALRKELTLDCMSGGCSGLLTTGLGPSSRVRDPKECESECNEMSMRSTGMDEVCIAPLPDTKPDKLNPKSPPNDPAKESGGQSDYIKKAAAKAAEGEEVAKARQANAADASQFSQNLQEKKIRSNEELLSQWDRELRTGRSQTFPPDRAKWQRDKALVAAAARAQRENKNFPLEKANQAELPAIRGNLNQFSRARQLESESAKNLSAFALTLAQLAQMKSAGQARGAALDKASAAAGMRGTFVPGESGQLRGVVSSSLQEKTASPEVESESPQAVPESPPAAASADILEPEASRASLRAQLRDLLQKRLAARGMSDVPEEFLGELGLSADTSFGTTATDQAAAAAAEEEEIFRLASAETDAEVLRLRAQLQEEIARSEGVLPSESLSLFERVRAAHATCAAKKCVGIEGTVTAARHPDTAPAAATGENRRDLFL